MSDTQNNLQWLDLSQLQKIQESFSAMTGMSAVAIDLEGNSLTEKTGGSTFCDLLVGQSKIPYTLCRECRIYGAKEAATLRKGCCYNCHMGLVEFSAPITLEGKMLGCFIGGMVFEKAPVKEKIYKLAACYGIDPELLWEAAKRVPVRPRSAIEKAAAFLFNMAEVLSGYTDSKINMARSEQEVIRTAQLKDDFLANMSHEIRTPMNAVVGIADIALQEDMSSTHREYFEQIQNSGKALIHIINDILDYSKISSGKMDIIEEEYEPAKLMRDISTIISNRIKDKSDRVSLNINFDPRTPRKLFGDSARIQQVIINLANNAVKFTHDGSVTIDISFRRTSNDQASFRYKVIDTGIGIKPEDIDKLFHSFSQVDSKRNRKIEGTGLGLAIVKQLVDLMHGEVKVTSEYEKGSTFSFEIPQKVIDWTPIVVLNNPGDYVFHGIFPDIETEKHLERIADSLGITSRFSHFNELDFHIMEDLARENVLKKFFMFVDQRYVEEGLLEEIGLTPERYPQINVVMVLNAFEDDHLIENRPYLKIIKKPLYTFSVAGLLDYMSVMSEVTTDVVAECSFTAPAVKVLIVDDVPMNLKVAQRLISRYKIASDLAASGPEALEMIADTEYDIIFMDHMMPEIDGIDTTRLIRRFHPKLNNIPIIALTANVMGDAKKMFLDEGMNDLLSKPIESKDLKEILLRWIPPNKIIYD